MEDLFFEDQRIPKHVHFLFHQNQQLRKVSKQKKIEEILNDEFYSITFPRNSLAAV
jgi:hypothetical protein